MRNRILAGALLGVIGLPLVFIVAGGAAEPAVKWAIVTLVEPTTIAGCLVSGPVIFVHDDARMVRGEPGPMEGHD